MSSASRGSARPSTAGPSRSRFGSSAAPPKPKPKTKPDPGARPQYHFQDGSSDASSAAPFPALVGSGFHMRDSAELRRQNFVAPPPPSKPLARERPKTADGRLLKGSPHKAAASHEPEEPFDVVLTGNRLYKDDAGISPKSKPHARVSEAAMANMHAQECELDEGIAAQRHREDAVQPPGSMRRISYPDDEMSAGDGHAAEDCSSVSSGDAVNQSFQDVESEGESESELRGEEEVDRVSDPVEVETEAGMMASSAENAAAAASSAREDVRTPREVAAVDGAGGSARSSLEQARVQAASTQRGTLAARAQMGKRRVLGAVTVQRWFRVLLQRREHEERSAVRGLLQGKREKLKDEHARREREKMEEERKKRGEEEARRQAEEARREEEVEEACVRLKRKVERALPPPSAAVHLRLRMHAAGKARAAPASVASSEDGAQREEGRSEEERASGGVEGGRRAEPQPQQLGDEDGEEETELTFLSHVLRVSVERSADAVGLDRKSVV